MALIGKVVFKSLSFSLESELARRMMNSVEVFGLVALSIPLFVIVTHRFYSKDKQMKKKSEQEEVITNVSWSELAPDLLGEIVCRLCLTEQPRFLLVCKNWLAAAVTTNSSSSSSSLPWLARMIPGSPSQFHQIFDPLSSSTTPASIQNISWSNLGIPSPPSTLTILYLQHNWLLLSFVKPQWFNISRRRFNISRRYFLVFSPLTKKVITLPPFDHERGIKFTASFSTLPNSPDCVYCMVDADYTDKILVITYRNGDKEWTARQFNKVPGFLSCSLDPLFFDGIIYFVSRFGQVASYNILSGEFNFDRLSVDTLLDWNDRLLRRWKVFVLNEEPMILYYDPDGTRDLRAIFSSFAPQIVTPQCIKRYDRSSKVWIPATTLLGYTLFFGQKIFNVSLINTKGGRNNGVLSNKICHFVNGGCHVYSLENGNLVRFKSINSNLLEDGGGELPEYKYNYDGIPYTDIISAYWLKPPCVRSSFGKQSRYNQGDSVRESCGGGQSCGGGLWRWTKLWRWTTL